MIKHFLEALYLPYVRSNNVTGHNIASGVNSVFMVVAFMLLFLIGFVFPRVISFLWPNRLALDSYGVIIPCVFAFDYLTRIISPKNGYINSNIGSFLTLPVKRRDVFWFSFARYCFSDNSIGLQPLLLSMSISLIAPVYGVLPVLACVASFYIWSLINNLINSEAGATPYSTEINAIVICFYGLWSYMSVKHNLCVIPLRAICDGYAVIFLVLQPIMLFAVANIYIFYKSRSRYSVMEGGIHKQSVVNLPGFASVNSVLKMRLRILMLNKSSVIPIGLFVPAYTIIMMNTGSMGANKGWLFFLVFVVLIITGRNTFAYESHFFDRLVTLPFSLNKIVKTDYILFNVIQIPLIIVVMLACDAISVSYAVSVILYAFGPISAATFYLAAWTPFKVDPLNLNRPRYPDNRGMLQMFSYLVVPCLLLLTPYLVEEISGSSAAQWYMLISGVVFVLASPFWIKLTILRFNKNKYKNLKVYRDEI